MAVQFDLALKDLREYEAGLVPPEDFDAFWGLTLAEAREFPLSPTFTAVDAGLPLVDVFDVSFAGWGGQRIAAWLVMPSGTTTPLPTVVEYIGYSGGRGFPHDHLVWAAAGYAHLIVDTRSQGSATFSVGATSDHPGPVGPHSPGFMTMGIESPQAYYYRRVFTDAVRATEVVTEHPLLDAQRIVVAGVSQGGGITIAVAGLVPGLLGAMPDVPFLCHMRRGTEITDARPYLEIAEYCSAHRGGIENAFHTLSYFDGVHFAARASAPTLFSAALMDQICPPSTVFAAYNNWSHPDKQISVYPYNGHEGGGPFQVQDQLAFVRALLDGSRD
ncbi:acetylxylan esterase [Nakamurella sp. PAMC28650]|uniref:acetylxylan esterase n=1 Tax=Nakamurella sp. PAMC28650 TaxID=2762325 RepID=UPI00164CFAAC|nr:acetylxylan esterase [Nakamurella sp. PAMC28650]QNK83228.1 acetylxylan esterase [Nakamurella sp. PAMC28650]